MQEERNWTVKCMNCALLGSHSPPQWLLFKWTFLSISFPHPPPHPPPPPHSESLSDSFILLIFLGALLLFLSSWRCFIVWNRNTVLEPIKWSENFQIHNVCSIYNPYLLLMSEFSPNAQVVRNSWICCLISNSFTDWLLGHLQQCLACMSYTASNDTCKW
jgi:hypothetical protein